MRMGKLGQVWTDKSGMKGAQCGVWYSILRGGAVRLWSVVSHQTSLIRPSHLYQNPKVIGDGVGICCVPGFAL